MRTSALVLDDAAQLAHGDWFAPLEGRPIPVSVRNINLPDARDTSRLLGRSQKATKDLYGFRPIPAGGAEVTNKLVNELREDLGF